MFTIIVIFIIFLQNYKKLDFNTRINYTAYTYTISYQIYYMYLCLLLLLSLSLSLHAIKMKYCYTIRLTSAAKCYYAHSLMLPNIITMSLQQACQSIVIYFCIFSNSSYYMYNMGVNIYFK